MKTIVTIIIMLRISDLGLIYDSCKTSLNKVALYFTSEVNQQIPKNMALTNAAISFLFQQSSVMTMKVSHIMLYFIFREQNGTSV